MAQHFKEQHSITWHDDTAQYIKEPHNKKRYSTKSQIAAWHNTAPHAQEANEWHGTTQHGTNIDRFLLAQFHLYVNKSDIQRFPFIPLFIYPHIVATSQDIHWEKANHLIIRPGSHHTFFTNNYQQKIPKVWVRWLMSQLCSLWWSHKSTGQDCNSSGWRQTTRITSLKWQVVLLPVNLKRGGGDVQIFPEWFKNLRVTCIMWHLLLDGQQGQIQGGGVGVWHPPSEKNMIFF